VLAAMNRRHGSDEFRRLTEKLRAARSDLALSSDFIVGFPGETEDDFEATLSLVREIGFIQAYSFKYSPRPGTPAAGLAGQLPDDVKTERLARLQDLLNAQQLAFNRACVGRVLPVLLDRTGKHPGQMVGRSPYMQPVHVSAPDSFFGTIADLRIEAGYANSLAGTAADGGAVRMGGSA
jgi:tRNA-2-methylthio-N6-dimethylallyladenosine synthase